MAFPAFLQREYQRRRTRNRRYSLRAFARDLGCDHSTLSQWMRGTRPLTRTSLDRLCRALALADTARARACEIDETDLAIVAVVRQGTGRTSPALARAAQVPVDRVNLALTKLMRLNVLRMAGSDWHLVEELR